MLLIYVFIIMRRNLSFFIFLFTTHLGICQSSNLVNDFQSWNSFELQYQKVNKTNFSFESGIRFDEDIQDVSKFLTDFMIKREFNKYLDYAIGLRYDQKKNNNNVFEKRLRWYFDCYLGYNINPKITLKSRTRYQFQSIHDDLFSSAGDDFNDSKSLTKKIRQKITLSHKKSKNFNIFITSEFFYEIGEGWEKYRLISGFKKKITKNLVGSLSGLFQSDFSNKKENSFVALRTKLIYTIK